MRDDDNEPTPPTSGWGQQLFSAVLRLEGRLDLLTDDERKRPGAEQVRTRLDDALAEANWAARWHLLHRLGQWWSGARIETAWSYVREADLLIVTCRSTEPEFRSANLTRALGEATQLPATDPDRLQLEALAGEARGGVPAKARATNAHVHGAHPPTLAKTASRARTGEVAAMRAVLDRAAQQRYDFHTSARAYRNRLVVATLLVLLTAAGIVLTQALVPQVKVVEQPTDATHVREWVLMVLVMLFGSLGALVSAIPAMASLPRVKGPYNFPLQQSLLKVAVGSVTSLVGVLVIGTGATTGFSKVAPLLAAAVVFGAGQRAVTGYLDKRAGELVAAMPGQASDKASNPDTSPTTTTAPVT